jgi:hypothetical protein
VSFNTIPPSDFGFFEWINENVQAEPATSYDVELCRAARRHRHRQGQGLRARRADEEDPHRRRRRRPGGRPGPELAPYDAHPDWAYYEGSMWGSMLWEGGAFFETPPPAFEDGEFKPLPPTGARTLDSRTAFYYGYTLDSPGMIMNIPGVGSQYLMAFLDPSGEPFDGAKTYKVTLPKDIPAKAFWSFTLYDNQTRSMLQTPQKYPRAGSQSYPSPAARRPRTAPRRSGSRPSSPTASRAATGSRPTRRRAGSRSCGSTARCRRSSTSPGGRARPSPRRVHLRPADRHELRGHVRVRRRHQVQAVQGAVQSDQQRAPRRDLPGHGSRHAQQRHAVLDAVAGSARRADGDLGAGIEKKRYYSVQLIDGNTYNYGYIGSRATGTEPGDYLVVGPRLERAKCRPESSRSSASTTPFSLALFRTQLFNPADMPNVEKVQAGYKAQPLSAFLKQSAPPAAPDIDFVPATTAGIKDNFFEYLDAALQFVPRRQEDKAIRAKLARDRHRPRQDLRLQGSVAGTQGRRG